MDNENFAAKNGKDYDKNQKLKLTMGFPKNQLVIC